jgi:SRSO17 transposase
MGSAARWQARRAAQDVGRVLLNDLGLDHFEGRSWRGFHHHACLVLLAYAFRARVVERPVSCAAAFA